MNIITNVKGTKDYFSKNIKLFRWIEKKFYEICELYGLEEIKTPILEYTNLFARSIGEYTDIVEKEMFTLSDSKGKKISLRPENTAGVVRSFIQNNLLQNPGPKKFFYTGPMFRHERPQAGRLRQFHQLGCEVFESDNPIVDAEIINLSIDFIKSIGIQQKNIILEINSVGCPDCRPAFTQNLKLFLENNFENLCENCKTRKDKNPLRVFDCKNSQCKEILNSAPTIYDNLCENCKTHFSILQSFLNELNCVYTINKKLVRGLDYYTKNVFEIKLINDKLGAQNTILAGGRYNNLVCQLAEGKINKKSNWNVPAFGFAAGLERLILSIQDNENKDIKKKKVFIVYTKETLNYLLKVCSILRKNNVSVNYVSDVKSFKSQFRTANKLNYKFVIILGEDEQEKKIIKVKDFIAKTETDIILDNLDCSIF